MHCTFKKQLKDWIEESQPGTDCENKHWCTDIQDSTMISDITKYKKKKKHLKWSVCKLYREQPHKAKAA